jgi:prepilin-type processing-associated H-X9-DG protein
MELLVVFAIIAVLAGLSVPAYKRVVESGRATACIANLRQLGVALSTYLSENNMTMPALAAGRRSLDDEAPVIDNTLDRYTKEKTVFACPSDRAGHAFRTGTSYYWNVALNGQALGSLNFLRLTDQHSRIPILADKEGFHPYTENKVNILYADGHATKNLSFVTEDPGK